MMKFGLILTVIGACAYTAQGTPVPSTCQPVCPANYVPLCGTDGVTYSNECMFICAQESARADNRVLEKRQDGACPTEVTTATPPVCSCSRDYKPVCGNDYKTYSNPCLLECAKESNKRLEESYSGPCGSTPTPQPPAVCVCPLNYLPVCGSDGKTYSNECGLNCAAQENRGLVKSANGACVKEEVIVVESPEIPATPTCACPLNYLPVCGSDRRTYPNECSLNCAKRDNRQLTKEGDGACSEEVEPEEPLTCFCTYIFSPVCGTNGVTYDNVCNLNCDKARVSGLEVARNGACEDVPPCTCTRELQPVCGTDGQTYSNDCLLECANRNSKQEIAVAYSGTCDDGLRVNVVDVADNGDSEQVQVVDKVENNPAPTACVCTREAKPVCGSDGVTYSNKCLLECEATKKGITLAYAGNCVANTSCSCGRNLSPVCGSNGVTYKNQCLLECNKGVSLARAGPC